MKTLSERDLCDNGEEILALVQQGETFTITRDGAPVAELRPAESSGLRCDRPALRGPRFSDLDRVAASVTSVEVLQELRSRD